MKTPCNNLTAYLYYRSYVPGRLWSLNFQPVWKKIVALVAASLFLVAASLFPPHHITFCPLASRQKRNWNCKTKFSLWDDLTLPLYTENILRCIFGPFFTQLSGFSFLLIFFRLFFIAREQVRRHLANVPNSLHEPFSCGKVNSSQAEMCSRQFRQKKCFPGRNIHRDIKQRMLDICCPLLVKQFIFAKK